MEQISHNQTIESDIKEKNGSPELVPQVDKDVTLGLLPIEKELVVLLNQLYSRFHDMIYSEEEKRVMNYVEFRIDNSYYWNIIFRYYNTLKELRK